MKSSSVHHAAAQVAAVAKRVASDAGNKVGTARGEKFSQILSQTQVHASPDNGRAASVADTLASTSAPNAGSASRTASPSWYSQYGDMTPFVPSQYIDTQYTLPALPQKPHHERFVPASAHTQAQGVTSSAHEWQAQDKAYLAELRTIRQQLNANFKSLPLDVQNQAVAAREAWLTSTDGNTIV